jgi:hypothetical protein
MKFRIFVVLSVVLLLIIVGSVYLAARSAADLLAARQALQGSVEDLDEDEIEEARDNVASAGDRLDGFLASVMGIVPVVGPNLGALEAVADGAEPVLGSALDLRSTADEIDEQDLVDDGRVRLDLVEQIGTPLAEEADALDGLFSKLEEARSGWLLPPVYEEITDLMRRADELRVTASKAAAASRLAPEMLGGAEPRTYLVLLLNNAELRGAGGVLSGVGTVTMRDGGIELGDFSPQGKLGSSPYERVEAPEEFARRFGFAKADTTLWINASYSPDVPDVALVASRLYDKVRKVETDGAIVVDPRGIAALMPPDATVETPSGGTLTASTLAEYIYSTAYEELGGNRDARRGSLLNIGRDVFKLLAERGPGGVDELDDIAEAVSSGHLRFVSFDPEEHELLERVGAAGSLPAEDDGVFVGVQNHGPDKLDFWIERSLTHRCSIEEEAALCETSVTLRNEAPDGLTRYVSPRPDDAAHEFVEIYLPGEADISAVELDGEAADVLRDSQAGLSTVGTDIELPAGEETTLAATYLLPLDGSYEVTIAPQPLAHDASVRVVLDAPGGWTIDGPEDSDEERLEYEGELTGSLRFEANPSDRSGLSSAWDALSDFWSDDLL